MTSTSGPTLRVWLPDDALVDELGPLPAKVVLDVLAADGPLPSSTSDAEVLVASFDLRFRIPELIDAMPGLRLVQSLHAGVEPLLAVAPPGVTVCSASGVHDIPVSEWVVGAILLSYKQFLGYRELQAREVWDPTAEDVTRGRVPSVGSLDDLEDKTVVIVGHGSIGRAVEARLVPFGARVVGVARSPRQGVRTVDALPELFAEADIVVVLAPGAADTAGLVDAHLLSRLRDGALVVNAARGTIIDQVALAAECARGRLRAVLDVTEPEPLPVGDPLWATPNVLVTPHVAGSTPRWRARAYRFVGDQLRRHAAGEPLENVRSGS